MQNLIGMQIRLVSLIMESKPVDPLIQNDVGQHQQLFEMHHVNALVVVRLEIEVDLF